MDENQKKKKKSRKTKSQKQASNRKQKEKWKAAGIKRNRNYSEAEMNQLLHSQAATLPIEARRLIFAKYKVFPSIFTLTITSPMY
jgi:hypothetical protein